MLATAHAAGMGVIVKEPLANGRLTSRGSVAALSDVAQRPLLPLMPSRLAAVLAQPWADVVLSGAATTDELESNLDALELDLGPHISERLDGVREDNVTYWLTRPRSPGTEPFTPGRSVRGAALLSRTVVREHRRGDRTGKWLS